MDAEDELVPFPDKRGFLDLSNRAWVHLDPVLFTMSLTLVTLDVSYNQMHELPSQIGELVLLRELRAPFNKIVTIPPEIGRLKRLKKLILNSNRIAILPEEVGRLEGLEELVLSENEIELLPKTISMMAALRVLKLQNNKLKKLPNEIAEVLTLEEIDCTNNKKLEMIPPNWRGDTESILFICRIHREYATRMDEMVMANGDLSKHSQFLEQEQLLMKDSIVELKSKMDEFKKNIPKKYLKKIEREMRQEDGDEEPSCASRCSIS